MRAVLWENDDERKNDLPCQAQAYPPTVFGKMNACFLRIRRGVGSNNQQGFQLACKVIWNPY